MSEIRMPHDREAGPFPVPEDAPLHRRRFLQLTVLAAAGTSLAASGCKIHRHTTGRRLDIGHGDLAVLNYAYALEQLEAAFYHRVTSHFFEGATEMEMDLLSDIAHDEVAHREWLREALVLKKLPKLTFDFSSIDFTDRTSVLEAARDFEDMGVSAYNGAGKLLAFSPFLTHAGKIVSVEARHAATIRNLISFGSFADGTADTDGRDLVRMPREVLRLTDKYFVTKISADRLRKS